MPMPDSIPSTSTAWYYYDGSQVVGPFNRETLTTLRHAGVIADETQIQSATGGEWLPFTKLQNEARAGMPLPIPPSVSIPPPLPESNNLADCKPMDARSSSDLAGSPAHLQNTNLSRGTKIILCIIALLVVWVIALPIILNVGRYWIIPTIVATSLTTVISTLMKEK